VKAIVQRSGPASVEVDGEIAGQIEHGLLVYVGVRSEDAEQDAELLARKVRHLRIFADDDGKMNLDVGDVGGDVLVVSNFTLYADARKGRRPSYAGAARPEQADRLYQHFCRHLADLGVTVATGRFQAMMRVRGENDGPINIIVATED